MTAISKKTDLDATHPSQEEFVAVIDYVLSQSEIVVLTGKTKRGIGPIGFMEVGRYFNAVIPHAHWFPWASPRQKLESLARYLEDTRRKSVVMILASYKHEAFWVWLGFLGLISKVGRIEGVYEDADCSIWKTVK